ncbi:MAG: pro-sigmaK processing inhibitor BofA family protein [Thermaerobacter sp.]|nr:pro-sigmaK processing inhibitor BofA family protein [Thermaerobacter sp.]
MLAHLWQYAAGVAAALALLWWFSPEIGRIAIGVVLRVLIGGAVIYAFDFVARPYGYSIGVNPVTASVLGVLGLPGAALLVVWHGLYG